MVRRGYPRVGIDHACDTAPRRVPAPSDPVGPSCPSADACPADPVPGPEAPAVPDGPRRPRADRPAAARSRRARTCPRPIPGGPETELSAPLGGPDTGFDFADPFDLGLVFVGFAVFAAVGALSHQRERAFSASLIYLGLGCGAAAVIDVARLRLGRPGRGRRADRAPDRGRGRHRAVLGRAEARPAADVRGVGHVRAAAAARDADHDRAGRAARLAAARALRGGRAPARRDPGADGPGARGRHRRRAARGRGRARAELRADRRGRAQRRPRRSRSCWPRSSMAGGGRLGLVGGVARGRRALRDHRRRSRSAPSSASRPPGASSACATATLLAADVRRLPRASPPCSSSTAWPRSPARYGFLAAFAGGIAFRRYETRPRGQRDASTRARSWLEKLLELSRHPPARLACSRSTGCSAPGWEGWLLAVLLLVAVRPLACLLALWRLALDRPEEKAFVAWFGVRGVGSLVLPGGRGRGRACCAAASSDLVVWTVIAAVLSRSSSTASPPGPSHAPDAARARRRARAARRAAESASSLSRSSTARSSAGWWIGSSPGSIRCATSLERGPDRQPGVVGVEHARVDVGGAADRGRVAEVAGDLLDRAGHRALARRLRRLPPRPTTASATAASTVAFQVRKSLAEKSPPVASLR